MKVLITGASGFIGNYVLCQLATMPIEVVAITSKPLKVSAANITTHAVDLFDRKEVESLIREVKATHLLHLAWYVEPKEFWSSKKNISWLNASIFLMRSFYSFGGSRVVCAGTSAEYGQNGTVFFESETRCQPVSVYGRAKHLLHQALQLLAIQYTKSYVWGRIFNPYGPGENSQKLISGVIQKLMNNQVAKCTEGTQVRDFIHVEDVASAFIKLLMSNVVGVFNVSSGRPVTVKEVLLNIASNIESKGLLKLGEIPMPESDLDFVVGDNSKLKTEVGWFEKFNLDSGIQQTVEEYKNSIKGSYENFD